MSGQEEKDVLSYTNTNASQAVGEVLPEKRANADLGLSILKDNLDGERYYLDPAMRKRVLRKIDLHILPILTFTTMLGFLEFVSLNYASIFGLLQDAHLDTHQFAWLGSIYYFGYLFMQPFVARILQWFTPGQCLSFAILTWGIIIFMTVLCDSFAKLMVVRFLLGAAEALVNPAFILISGAWYARAEQSFRFGIWFSANGLANIIGGISAYGLGHIHVDHLAPWKWFYLVVGALTILWAIAVYFLLPSSQGTARFFSEEEKVAAVEMVRDNNTGIHNRTFKVNQLKEAIFDWKSYYWFAFAFFGNLANSVATFGSLIISHFGYGPLPTTLLLMPVGGMEILVMIIGTYICGRFKNVRSIVIVACNIIALTGSIMVFTLPLDNKAGLLLGYYMFAAWPTGYALSLAMAASNTAGHTKKVVTNVYIMAGFCVSNIIGPQFFNKPPRYYLGIGSCIFTFAGMIVTAVVFQIHVMHMNKKRAPQRREAEIALGGRLENGFEDLTDKENSLFEYVY